MSFWQHFEAPYIKLDLEHLEADLEADHFEAEFVRQFLEAEYSDLDEVELTLLLEQPLEAVFCLLAEQLGFELLRSLTLKLAQVASDLA